MGYAIAVERKTSGTESLRLLDELERWAGEHGIPADRLHEGLLHLLFEVDYEPARQVVEDALAEANESWPTHVHIAPKRE